MIVFFRDLAKKLEMVEPEDADDEREDEEEGVEETCSALWVDQYAPKRYTDLLSDDVSNTRRFLIGGGALSSMKLWGHANFIKLLSRKYCSAIFSGPQSQ